VQICRCVIGPETIVSKRQGEKLTSALTFVGVNGKNLPGDRNRVKPGVSLGNSTVMTRRQKQQRPGEILFPSRGKEI